MDKIINDNFDLTADTYKATLRKDANIVSSTIQFNEKIINDLKRNY